MKQLGIAILSLTLTAACPREPLLEQARQWHADACPPRSGYVVPDSKYDLALSGGGYRAMLFHVGAAWRLHELGMLREVQTISSVSGGSITAAVILSQINRLDPADRGVEKSKTCFAKLIAAPLLSFSQSSIDWKAATWALLTHQHGGNVLSDYYTARLFGDATLHELPQQPMLMLQSTNLHTGSVWSFTQQEMGDAQIGYANVRNVRIADAVAASSAFPPVLSPFRIVSSGPWRATSRVPALTLGRESAAYKAYGVSAAQAPTALVAQLRAEGVLLTDGGVADNLGIEALARSDRDLLVSDGGAPARAVDRPSTGIFTQLIHITELIHAQPSELRFSELMDEFRQSHNQPTRDGAHWAIGRPLPRHTTYLNERAFYAQQPRASEREMRQLAATETRLVALDVCRAKKLINLGYHSVDWSLPYLNKLQGLRWHLISRDLPYPEATLWLGGPSCEP